jgi:hypothetical protein
LINLHAEGMYSTLICCNAVDPVLGKIFVYSFQAPVYKSRNHPLIADIQICNSAPEIVCFDDSIFDEFVSIRSFSEPRVPSTLLCAFLLVN